VRLLEDNPKILSHYRDRYRFLLVDEYQDVNHAQYRLVRLLSPLGRNLSVIGDPNQAIYGFRGADSRYFLQFENDYPDAETICLEQSFRSTETILHASARLLSGSREGIGDRLWSGISGEGFLSVAEYPTDRAEAESIVQIVEQLLGGTSYFSVDSGRVDAAQDQESRSFADFAVFYRLHAQGDVLEEAFHRSGIPFHRVGGEPLGNHPEVRQVLQALQNMQKDGIGSPILADRIGFEPEAHDESPRLCDVVRSVVRDLGFDPMDEVLKLLIQQAERWISGVSEFLARMALKLDIDSLDPRAEKVALMTLHASKGLEFPIVFVTGCEADLIPYRRKGHLSTPLDEERRLFYVGLTRAREKIILTRARKRTLYGRTENREPSPFLKEIEEYIRQRPLAQRKRSPKNDRDQLKLFG
jgi:DNA helicase-2/ATP-dependent DNA helicase PcrA